MSALVDLSVVVPVYGNNQFLNELNNRIINTLSSLNHEIIYVNDCSPDDSLTTLKVLSKEYPKIQYINLPKNLGQQKATLQGLRQAKGQKIVVLDGDLQDSPELISELYQKSLFTTNSIFVKRIGIYQSKGRMITSIIIKTTVQALSGLHYKAGSYYIFDRSILQDVTRAGTRCKYPYMSIIVALFSTKIQYIKADRAKSIGASGYTMLKRVHAAFMAMYCSLYCCLLYTSPSPRDA